MSNKKPIKLAVLSLIGLLGLAACSKSSDEVYAKPSNYDDAIVTFTDAESKIHNDVLSIIYDAMHDANANTRALDETMYLYAESVFGPYNKVTLNAGDESITLKDAYLNGISNNADKSVINNFVKAHRAYWEYNDEGQHIHFDEEGHEVVIPEGSEWTPSDTERAHVISKWLAVEDRIAEAMYKKISGGSYTTKNYFGESELLKALYQDNKKVNYVKDLTKMIIPYYVEGADVFKAFDEDHPETTTPLHRAYYQDSSEIKVENGDYSGCQYTYIEDDVIPSVYNDLLVEQYLLDEDIAAVRNSRARKINVIKIEKYANFSNNADLLVKALVNEIYANKPASDATHVNYVTSENEAFGEELFNKYALIAKGLYDEIQADDSAKEIVEDLNKLASDVYKPNNFGSYYYYENTTYGDLVKDFEKIVNAGSDPDDAWDLLEDTKFSTFTSNGSRSLVEGFEQQKIDIMQSKSVTKGWYIQSQTPTLDNDGKINDRLFKLSVANARVEVGVDGEGQPSEEVDDLDAADRYVLNDGVWELRSAPSAEENKFLCSINGMFFLKFEGQYSGDDWKNDIVYDDGNAYYIVQVIEAAKDSKLRNTSATSYANTRGQAFMDEVVDEVAKIVGETGSYTSLSRNHWLEKMSLEFHDQKIYDYFKSNYPDLFED